MSSALAAEILARTAESQKSGPIGLAVILVLCIAVYFLMKSMSKHLKKVRDEFPEEIPGAPASTASAAVVVSPTATPEPAEIVPPAAEEPAAPPAQ